MTVEKEVKRMLEPVRQALQGGTSASAEQGIGEVVKCLRRLSEVSEHLARRVDEMSASPDGNRRG